MTCFTPFVSFKDQRAFAFFSSLSCEFIRHGRMNRIVLLFNMADHMILKFLCQEIRLIRASKVRSHKRFMRC